MKIEERIDKLKDALQDPRFIKMKGLGNEVPYYIFDYPPDKELLIRETIPKLIGSFSKKDINILEINLYNLVLEILFEKVSPEKLIEYERKKGSKELLEKIRPMLKTNPINQKIKEKVTSKNYDIIFISGVGSAWPMIRSHQILNNLQSIISQIPLILFYPGEYTKYDLSLFGKLKEGNYYRAFRLIDYTEEVR